ncbi:MAG TPA: hypothetical protein DCS30_06375 [Rhizobiales bacterium]|nr:hypothetical protein [Hyphomicrobiales bacterium]
MGVGDWNVLGRRQCSRWSKGQMMSNIFQQLDLSFFVNWCVELNLPLMGELDFFSRKIFYQMVISSLWGDL